MDAPGPSSCSCMGYSSQGSQPCDHGYNQSLLPADPWQTCVGAPLIPAGCVGYPRDTISSMNVEVGRRMHETVHTPVSSDLDTCALKNPGSSHAECSFQGWCYWKQRARFICFLDTLCEALGNTRPDIKRAELEETSDQEQEGALLEVTPLDWQVGRTPNRGQKRVIKPTSPGAHGRWYN